MKVLMYVGYPIDFAQGGHAIQIRNTCNKLEELGVEIEWLHNEKQDISKKYDIIHFWSYPTLGVIEPIKEKLNLPMIWSTMDGLIDSKNYFKKVIIKFIHFPVFEKTPLHKLVINYKLFDKIILLSDYEKNYWVKYKNIQKNKICVIPNGIEDIYFKYEDEKENFDGLLQIGAITEVKNSIEVAIAAKNSCIPVKFIGDFRLVDQNYKDTFLNLVDNKYIFFEICN